MNETKTIMEIIAEHQDRAGKILNGLFGAYDGVRQDTKLEDSPYLDRLSDGQKRLALLDLKTEKAASARREALKAYTEQVERYAGEISTRKAELRRGLFGLSAPESAATLARAAVAPEEELAAMLDLADATSNAELSKIVFAEASRRELGTLSARYLLAADEQTRALHEEWRAMPAEEVVERQLDSVEQVVPQVPDPERLAGTPPLNTGGVPT